MLYLVTGKEELLREEFLGQLKTLMRNLPMGEHNIEELGPGTAIRDVIAACDAYPFLCEKRMVIARGVVAHSGRARGRSRRAVAEATQTPVDELVAYLPNLPSSTHLVLVEDETTALQPLSTAAPEAVKRDFARLRDDAVPRWIVERASKRQARISPRAADELGQLVGSELRSLDSEIGKLVSYVDVGGTIGVDEVRLLVAGAGPTIFELHDAVAERRPAAALAATRSLMQRGSDPAELLAQLAALIRRLLVVKELVAEHRAPARDAPAFEVRSGPYALQKLQRQSARLSTDYLERAYALLASADLALKTGRMDPELIIELVVSSLVGVAPLAVISPPDGYGNRESDPPIVAAS